MAKDRENPPESEVQELGLELEKYQRIVENASDAVVTINQNHEVVYMNLAAERMFGYAREEILGGDVGPLVCPEHRDHHRHYVERYVGTGRSRVLGHSAHMLGRRRNGERFPLAISFSVAHADGQLLFTAIMRDLSEQKDLEEEVKKAQSLAMVGRMVATVSHEIRTPLSLIGGFARQVAKEEGLSEKGRRKLGIVVEEVGRLETMLNELNDLSRPQRYRWEEVNLAQLVEHVLEVMDPKLSAQDVTVEVVAEPGLGPVAGDRARLSQVLINLINNAVQAGEDAPRIAITVGMGRDGGQFLEVADQGQGISPENLAKIFQPFFTTKQRGSGLGLPLAQRIVEEHGGRLGLSSRPGKGTKARFTLPPKPDHLQGED